MFGEIFEDGVWNGIKYLLFWKPIYPRLSRLMHRFHIHYMPVSHMPDGTLHWCHWCGARHFEPSPFANIAQAHAQQMAMAEANACTQARK